MLCSHPSLLTPHPSLLRINHLAYKQQGIRGTFSDCKDERPVYHKLLWLGRHTC